MVDHAGMQGDEDGEEPHRDSITHIRTNPNPSRSGYAFKNEKYKPAVDFGLLKLADWAATPLGELQSWPACLKALASLLVTLPFAAAIFWGEELIMIHNAPWAIVAAGTKVGQGKRARELFGDMAVGHLQAALNGQVHSADSENFFSPNKQDVRHLQTLLHPICGESQGVEGVMAQFINRTNASKGSSQKQAKAKDSTRTTNGDSSSQTNEDESEGQHIQNAQPEDGKPMAREEADADGDMSMDDLPIDGKLLFQKFAHMIPTGLAILDSDAEALFVNDLFYKLTTHPGENPFRSWPQSIHPEDYDRVMGEYKDAFHSEHILSTQFRSAGPGEFDSPAWRLFMMRPLSSTAPIAQDGYICAIIDITSLKAAELYQERVANEAIERKKQQEKFMDMISHEIRNPLSAILHCAEGIMETLKEVPCRTNSDNTNTDKTWIDDITEAAETILFCVAHQKNIVDDILSFSKLDAMMMSLSPSPCRPDQKLPQYLRIFQTELKDKQIDVHFAVDTAYVKLNVQWVNADMVRINQVLVNLMTNAIKFTAKKKGKRKITISLGASLDKPESYPPSVVFFQDDDAHHRMDATLGPEWGDGQLLYLLVAVKDTGIGIGDKAQARLFERFRQATPKTEEEYGGSGLGLFISRKLCQLHGGDVGVSSKEGEGSTFGFYFRVRRIDQPNDAEVERRDEALNSASMMSSQAVINEETPESLVHPPIEDRPEVNAATNDDQRHEHTAKIVNHVHERMDKEQADAKQKVEDDRQEWSKEKEDGQWDNESKNEHEERQRRMNMTRPANQAQVSSEQLQHAASGEGGSGFDMTSSLQNSQTSGKGNRDSQGEQGDSKVSENSQGDDLKAQSNPATTTAIKPGEQDPGKSGHDKQQGQDRPGIGVTRTSNLPFGDNRMPSGGPGRSRSTAPSHVLLVEDNVVNQRVLQRHLKAKGFKVSTADNGQIAVDMHSARMMASRRNGTGEEQSEAEKDKERDEGGGQFDCILMDQEMPVMDGNTATKLIRRHETKQQQKQENSFNPTTSASDETSRSDGKDDNNKHNEDEDENKDGSKTGGTPSVKRVPILGISANAREAQRDGMLEAGMDDVISKPFAMDDLVKKIKEIVENGEVEERL